MKKLFTFFLISAALFTVSAQTLSKKEASNTIIKTLIGEKYEYPVVGEMGLEKISSGAINDKGIYIFKNKGGKELFWFNIENTTMDYYQGTLFIWYGFTKIPVDLKEAKANKIMAAFSTLKEMEESGDE
ncbi:MAG: hypothetical protein K0M56_07635 [Kaistella sp.]|nr:hypothetical protein [Kaistella sp.]